MIAQPSECSTTNQRRNEFFCQGQHTHPSSPTPPLASPPPPLASPHPLRRLLKERAMAPSDYAKSRELAKVQSRGLDVSNARWNPSLDNIALVDGRPYLPILTVDASNPGASSVMDRYVGGPLPTAPCAASVIDVAVCTVLLSLRISSANGAADVGQGAAMAVAAAATTRDNLDHLCIRSSRHIQGFRHA